MPKFTVDRDCYDAAGVVVKAGGVATLEPDARAGQVLDVKKGTKRPEYPPWATPIDEGKSAGKEKPAVK